MFDANGFPLWLAVVALVAAGAALAWRKSRGRVALNAFDLKATLPLRGVLVALVTLGHLKSNCAWATVWLPWVGWQTPAVAVFFFLSGYGLFKSYESHGCWYLEGFVPRSLKKLVLPLISVVLFYDIWLQFHGRLIPLFSQFWRDGNTPVPNTWYVYALIVMYVLWWATWKLLSNFMWRIAALWCGTLAYFSVMEFVLDWNFVWARTIFAFPLGATYAACEGRVQSAICRHPLFTYLGAVFLLLSAIFIRAFVPGAVVAIAGRGISSTLGLWLVLVWYAFALPQWRVLRFLGKISYELYLVHGVVIALSLPLLTYGFSVFAGVVLGVSMVAAAGMNRVGSVKRDSCPHGGG